MDERKGKKRKSGVKRGRVTTEEKGKDGDRGKGIGREGRKEGEK